MTSPVTVKSTTRRSPDRPGNGAARRPREDNHREPVAARCRGMVARPPSASGRGSPPNRRSSGARTGGCSVQIHAVQPSAEAGRGALKRVRSHRGEEIEMTPQHPESGIPHAEFHGVCLSYSLRSLREFEIEKNDLGIAGAACGNASTRRSGFPQIRAMRRSKISFPCLQREGVCNAK